MEPPLSVEKLIETLPLPYKAQLIYDFRHKIGQIVGPNLLTSDTQRRAHGIIPLLFLVRWFEETSQPCLWCFTEFVSRHKVWIDRWTFNDSNRLSTSLLTALLMHIIKSCRFSGWMELDQASYVAKCDGKKARHYLHEIRQQVVDLNVLERWKFPFMKTLMQKCQDEVVQIYESAIWKAEFFHILTLMTSVPSSDEWRTDLIAASSLISLLIKMSPRVPISVEQFLASCLTQSNLSPAAFNKTLEALFYGLPEDRFVRLAPQLFREVPPLFQIGPNDDDKVLALSREEVFRLASFYSCVPARTATLDAVLLWVESYVNFEHERLLSAICEMDFALQTMKRDLECEITECRESNTNHFQLTDAAIALVFDVMVKCSNDEDLMALYKRLLNKEDALVRRINLFTNLGSSPIGNFIRFLESGCPLEFLFWLIKDHAALDRRHKPWIQNMLAQCCRLEASYSSLFADVIMMTLTEAPRETEISKITSLLVSSDTVQLSRSIKYAQLIELMGDAKVFSLITYAHMCKFLMYSGTEIRSVVIEGETVIEKVMVTNGTVMWLPTICVILRQLTNDHIPNEDRQHFTKNLPLIDDPKEAKDKYYEIRKLADKLIASINSCLLAVSGDPLLTAASLECLEHCLIVHSTCCVSLMSRIRNVWKLVDSLLRCPIISKAALVAAKRVIRLAISLGRDFTMAT